MRHGSSDVGVGSRNVLLPCERSISLGVLRGDELSWGDEFGTRVEETGHRQSSFVAVHYGTVQDAFVSSVAGRLHNNQRSIELITITLLSISNCDIQSNAVPDETAASGTKDRRLTYLRLF